MTTIDQQQELITSKPNVVTILGVKRKYEYYGLEDKNDKNKDSHKTNELTMMASHICGNEKIKFTFSHYWGCTALTLAINARRLGLISFLLSHGADPDTRDSRGWTALLWCIWVGNMQIVSLLIAHGADVNMPNARGWTPLIMAANFGRVEVIRLLLENGASIDNVDMDGGTALMHATYHGRNDVVRLLLSKGATMDIHAIIHPKLAYI